VRRFEGQVRFALELLPNLEGDFTAFTRQVNATRDDTPLSTICGVTDNY